MRRRLGTLLYPILFAASLVPGIAARGAGQYRATDLALVTAAVALCAALGVALVLLLVRLFERSDRAEPLAATLAMLVVAWFFFYVPAQRTASLVTYRFTRDHVLVPIGVLATIGIVVWLLRQRRERLAGINSFMTRMGVLLVGLVLLQTGFSQRGTPAAAQRSALVRRLAEPIGVTAPLPAGRNSPKRDIYLIVLDGHPNTRVVREAMHFDNSKFDDSLRALGFTIPRDMRSNYAQTILSIPSLINASHLTQLAADAGPDNPSFALPRYLLENNRVARFLKTQGYKYVLFPSAWWTPTQHSPLADEEYDARPDFSVANEVRRTELRLAVLNSTLLKYRPDPKIDTLYDMRSMEGIRRMPADSAPTFVFAHFLLPHIPYYLDESCHAVKHPILPLMEDTTAAQRAAYLAQIRCVDGMVLGVVTSILRDSPTPPVIVIVGDHGSRFTDPAFVDHPDRLSPAFMREHFGAFGAFHLPAGGDSALAGSVTLVNVMGHVLRHYFNAALPPSPDDLYVSGTKPYTYLLVDSTGYLQGR